MDWKRAVELWKREAPIAEWLALASDVPESSRLLARGGIGGSYPLTGKRFLLTDSGDTYWWADDWSPEDSKFKFEFPNKDFVAVEAGGRVFVLGAAESIPPDLLPGTWILVHRGDETEVVSLDRGFRLKFTKPH